MNTVRRLLKTLLLAAVLGVVVPASCLAWSVLRREPVAKDTILHLTLDGPLADAPQPTIVGLVAGRMHTTLQALCETLREAAGDPRVKGLLLEVKTPGLGLGHLAEVTSAVAAFRKSGKWTAAFVETLGEAQPGDQMLALAASAQHLFLAPPGSVYLAGLRAEVPFFADTLARLKVTAHVEQRYEFKNYANTFTEGGFTLPHREALGQVLGDLQGDLLRIIAEGRQVSPEVARGWVAGAPYTAAAAVQAGIVDQAAYFDEVLAAAAHAAGRADPLLDVGSYRHRRQSPLRREQGPEVALIPISGTIVSGEQGSGPMGTRDHVGSDTIAAALRDAQEDRVRAVVLRIDSPGGGFVASDIIRREVERTREVGIPVVVSMGNVAASGGYFIACAAEHIVAQPTTQTGSIGVVAVTFALRQALEHFAGVHFGILDTLPHAGVVSWLDPPSPLDRERLSGMVDGMYRDFVGKVASGRHKTFEQVQEVARGHVWSGRQALARGLVDELGGLDTALAWVRRKLELPADAPLDLSHYPAPDTTLVVLRQLLTAEAKATAPARAAAALPPPLAAAVGGWRALLAGGDHAWATMPPWWVAP